MTTDRLAAPCCGDATGMPVPCQHNVKPTRPWLVMGRSHEWEHNGRVGRRFSTEERANAFARRAVDDLCWYNVCVVYNEVTR